MSRIRLTVLILTLGAAAFAPRMAIAQSSESEPVVVDPVAGTVPDIAGDPDPGDGTAHRTGHGVTPLVAPIPFRNTQLGWGLMLMGGLIHRFDPDTTIKPSTGVAGGFYTENGSWGVMGMENARLAGDSWRLRLMLGHPEIRYDFYGVGEEAGNAGRSVSIQQNMNLASVAALGRVANNIYLGGTALYIGATVEVRDTSGLGIPPTVAAADDLQLFALGLQGEVDTRDDDYWPTQGTLARVKAMFFMHALGGDQSFQRYVAFWSWYAPVSAERLVLVANLNASSVGGDAPFWALPAVGVGRGGLRGYTQGRFRDSVMTTEQVELRYHGDGRFGAVVFVGMGHVAPTFGDIFSAQVLPAGGLGVRYQLTEKYPMHLRFDYSWGRTGSLFYFSVSEAF